MGLKALIADGSITERVRLGLFLRSMSTFDTVQECDRGFEAIEAMATFEPDLALLAVDLPEASGVEVMACASGRTPPASVFVVDGDRTTAAILAGNGFHVLVGPVERRQLLEATGAALRDRPRDRRELDRRLAAVLERLHTHHRPLRDRLVVRHHGDVTIVPVSEVDWIGAARNYVRLHAGEKVHTLRTTMAELERRLDPRRFLRIHRSVIVNGDRLRGVRPWFHGDSVVVLADGTRLNISRGYRPRVRQFLSRLAAEGD